MLDFLKDNMDTLAGVVDESFCDESRDMCETIVYKLHDCADPRRYDVDMEQRVLDFLEDHEELRADLGDAFYDKARSKAHAAIRSYVYEEFGRRLPDDDECDAVLDEICSRTIVPRFRDCVWAIRDYAGLSNHNFDDVMYLMGVYNS